MRSTQLAGFALIAELLLAPILIAQTASVHPAAVTAGAPDQAAASLSFEVISIKQNRQGTGGWSISSPQNGDNLTITNVSPHMLIGLAFDLPLHDEIYGLPGWTDQETYDVVAKVPEDELQAFHQLLPMQRNPMLQKVLESRFHLKYHYETKLLPEYALVIGKKGSRLVEASGANGPGTMRPRHGEIVAEAASMADLAKVLSQQIGRPIADETGLKGAYNFKLDWSPEMDPNSAGASAGDSGPSVFTALQEQLGLKLSAAKVPVRVLVVDHIDRPDQD
jgi:uncharacterized protein (TIGR03435 family)